MTDILQIAEQHLLKVKRSGNENIMAVCPFHRKADGTEEKSPSFAMNVHSGLWYCHSCHTAGNLFSFLRDVGVPRSEIDFRYKAVIEAAERYAPAKFDPFNLVAPSEGPLDESFLGLFDLCPQLLLDEGYPEALLRRFDIGFDEKHMRITFPLRDHRGRLVGISGRTVTDAPKRYKVYDYEYKDFNLPPRQTEKRALLWNVHNVIAQMTFERNTANRFVVVTEGFKAALRVAQADVPSVVALLGSHMSKEQEQYLLALGCPILLMLDQNDAGRLGQMHAVRRLMYKAPSVHVVDYEADQPSDLTTAAILDALIAAKPAIPWFIENNDQYF